MIWLENSLDWNESKTMIYECDNVTLMTKTDKEGGSHSTLTHYESTTRRYVITRQTVLYNENYGLVKVENMALVRGMLIRWSRGFCSKFWSSISKFGYWRGVEIFSKKRWDSRVHMIIPLASSVFVPWNVFLAFGQWIIWWKPWIRRRRWIRLDPYRLRGIWGPTSRISPDHSSLWGGEGSVKR